MFTTASVVLFHCRPDREINTEKPLRYEAMTGLNNEQLIELVTRVHAARGGGFASRGRPYALGLFGSVALVVCLMRKNIITQPSPVRSSASVNPR